MEENKKDDGLEGCLHAIVVAFTSIFGILIYGGIAFFFIRLVMLAMGRD